MLAIAISAFTVASSYILSLPPPRSRLDYRLNKIRRIAGDVEDYIVCELPVVLRPIPVRLCKSVSSHSAETVDIADRSRRQSGSILFEAKMISDLPYGMGVEGVN